MTVVLSNVSRSVTDIKITTAEEDSLRAFSAAEAGVEEVLLNSQSSVNSVDINYDSSATFNAEILPAPSGNVVSYKKDLNSGEIATFWLSAKDANEQFTCISGSDCYARPQITIYWGKPGSGSMPYSPAIEVSVFYDSSTNRAISSPNDFSEVSVARGAYDRYATTRVNNFDSSVSQGNYNNIDGKDYIYRKIINLSSDLGIANGCHTTAGCLLMLRVRMLYNNEAQPVAISSGNNAHRFPAQGMLISSTGQSGEATRKVEVFRGYSEAPAVIDAAVFSMNSLEK